MNLHELVERITTLMVEGQSKQAETLLQAAYAQAGNNTEELDMICGLFVQVYCSWEPPNLTKAEHYAEERERIKPTAYNGLQTAMMLYYCANLPERTVTKLKTIIDRANTEQDSSTLYTALGLIGQSYIDLGRENEASAILRDIEQMISTKSPIVGSDATSFLEAAFAKGIERETVQRIAAVLAPLCRDMDFRTRLQTLLPR